jgi:hypothetical protein
VQLDELKRVLLSAGSVLPTYFPDRSFRPMAVEYDAQGPYLWCEGAAGGQTNVMRLSASGVHWCQYIYQFAHELGHVVANADQPGTPDAGWFGESLAEVFALSVLRRTAGNWKTHPPYPGWESFAPSLWTYAEDLIKPCRLSPGQTLAQWYGDHETALRHDSTNRPLNAVVAAALLPLFEANPAHWKALSWIDPRAMSGKDRPTAFREFLDDWLARCPGRHKPFVRRIAAEFGIPPAPLPCGPRPSGAQPH